MGVVVCFMLLTTLITVAKPTVNQYQHEVNEPVAPSFNVDAPVWEIGDTWVYKIDNISFCLDDENQTVDVFISINELPLEVVNVTDENYLLTYTTEVSGICKVDVDLGDGPVNFTVTFTNLAVDGNLVINKTALGIKDLSVTLKGRFLIDIIEQPYIELPFTLPQIRFPVNINATSACENPIAMLTFPLSTGLSWGITETNITFTGQIRSIWFNIIRFINNIAKFFNRAFLPPEIEALLPVVNIREALALMGYNNTVTVPTINQTFTCTALETITVPAGTYDVYNISILQGLAWFYYAPDAGSVIKIMGNLEELIPYLKNMNMELLETNHR